MSYFSTHTNAPQIGAIFSLYNFYNSNNLFSANRAFSLHVVLLMLLKCCKGRNFNYYVLYSCYMKFYFCYIFHIYVICFNIYLLYSCMYMIFGFAIYFYFHIMQFQICVITFYFHYKYKIVIMHNILTRKKLFIF